ncbi:DUF6634 family protein [Methylobacterium haplocladii]|uniref:Uncharacterized protein n=1 Tax=Methylobacterium haplocladii TaxID=1176176 RepID=A0A512IUZ0_9HYPH|nr:DUF6634 family protein [Methylobacterium haplocladii]GEP01520.1 hypothetical protein MHA02_39070 [Methylobacterium haplocladii]GJD82294.1 hypothetical protein HPGCJGGD_0146 [Methylobacterium haplocladii]GLS59172.1 hypothetical protein GCM10007887_18380 [Methylobacterium haplocladii]
MPDPILLLASEIGSKLLIDDEYLRPGFFDPGSPMEKEPLASEMLAIAEGREPTQDGLAGAPILDDWWQVAHPLWGYVVLLGRVTGHPLLGNANIHTSALRAIALDLTWARTTSRLYRLGIPRLAGSPPSTTC